MSNKSEPGRVFGKIEDNHKWLWSTDYLKHYRWVHWDLQSSLSELINSSWWNSQSPKEHVNLNLNDLREDITIKD